MDRLLDPHIYMYDYYLHYNKLILFTAPLTRVCSYQISFATLHYGGTVDDDLHFIR